MRTTRGFMTLDAAIASSIAAALLVILFSTLRLNFIATDNNLHAYNGLAAVQQDLANVQASADWTTLAGTSNALTPSITASYATVTTPYHTVQLTATYQVYGKTYSFLLERRDPNG